MHKNKLNLEIFLDGRWQVAATLSCPDTSNGYKSPSTLAYEESFIESYILKSDIHALSCRTAVSYEFHRFQSWPPFILDIMPSGAGRRFWLSRLNVRDIAASDWLLLSSGSSNAPGNIRIQSREDHTENPTLSHPGFTKEKILERNEDFISYALETGAPIAGSSGAQGDAPKFLLTEDQQGKWHADGALIDSKAKKHWIIKFPRGKHDSDKKILKNEAEYMRLASLAGMHIHELPQYENDALFIPRFDRQIHNTSEENTTNVVRLGLESLCSANGVSEFGFVFTLEDLCKTIFRYSTKPEDDILEFIFRDFLNIICGNTDNHARNSCFLKNIDGSIRLSPLYDFAPMYLDREGIARMNKWKFFEKNGCIQVEDLVSWLEKEFKFKRSNLQDKFDNFKNNLIALPKLLEETNIDSDIKARILDRWDSFKTTWP